MYLLVGNWCPGPGEKGFSIYEYDKTSGLLTFLNHGYPDVAASFLTGGTSSGIVYATNETDAVIDGSPADQIVVLDVSDPRGGVKVIDRAPSLGANPTWVCKTFDGKHLLVTHHGGFANISTVGISEEGVLREEIIYDKAHVVLYSLDEGGLPERPEDAFLPRREDVPPDRISRNHSVINAPGKNLYLVCDKGLDMVLSITVDKTDGQIVLLDSVSVPKDSAPRYGVFHHSLPFFYADMEGCTKLYAFTWNHLGKLQIVQSLELLDAAETGEVMPSDIILNADGTRLYVGLRGINCIAAVDLDADGTMQTVRLYANADGAPNALRLSPDEKYLFVTNVFEKVITKFAVADDGTLEYAGIAGKDRCPASMLFFE